MALRKLVPLVFRAQGVSDAVDGTNAFPGAMVALTNLVHAPGTDGVFVPRAAAVSETNFPGFWSQGVISCMEIIGTRVYGMIGGTGGIAGLDRPFVFDYVTNTFFTITGANQPALLPTTQSTSGDWTPPTIASPTPARVVFTHPGFSGGGGPYFGWLDMSGYTSNFMRGNLTSGSPIITSIYDGGTSAPIIDGVTVGMQITGAGIPANTTVIAVSNGTFTHATTGDTNGTTALNNLADTTGVAVGMIVTGPEFAAGTYVAAIVSSTAVTLSTAALGTATGTAAVFSGGGTITLSNNASASSTLVTLTISGGTTTTPLWCAGNTNVNALSSPPAAVAAFNGRAYYAVKNALVFSDILNPSNVTNASQALLLDSTNITALAGQPLTSQLTGGIVQSLFAFKGADAYYQITGDAALNTLTLNVIAGSVGTLAPNTICETPEGLAYIAPDGLRIINPGTGLCTDPIGAFGSGVSLPFINAINPTRMCAAYGQNTIRVTCQNGSAPTQPVQEYFFNFQKKHWTGPHTFPYSHIAAYNTASTMGVGFLGTYDGIPSTLWNHSVVPTVSSTYKENNVPLSWVWETCLLPDNESLAMNRMVKTTFAMILPTNQTVVVTAYDDSGGTIDTVSLSGPTGAGAPKWGSVTWGAFTWGGGVTGYFRQWRVSWHLPLIFKQSQLSMAGSSGPAFAIGNLYMGYQELGYMLESS